MSATMDLCVLWCRDSCASRMPLRANEYIYRTGRAITLRLGPPPGIGAIDQTPPLL